MDIISKFSSIIQLTRTQDVLLLYRLLFSMLDNNVTGLVNWQRVVTKTLHAMDKTQTSYHSGPGDKDNQHKVKVIKQTVKELQYLRCELRMHLIMTFLCRV